MVIGGSAAVGGGNVDPHMAVARREPTPEPVDLGNRGTHAPYDHDNQEVTDVVNQMELPDPEIAHYRSALEHVRGSPAIRPYTHFDPHFGVNLEKLSHEIHRNHFHEHMGGGLLDAVEHGLNWDAVGKRTADAMAFVGTAGLATTPITALYAPELVPFQAAISGASLAIGKYAQKQYGGGVFADVGKGMNVTGDVIANHGATAAKWGSHIAHKSAPLFGDHQDAVKGIATGMGYFSKGVAGVSGKVVSGMGDALKHLDGLI
jgi:hypothetical protein